MLKLAADYVEQLCVALVETQANLSLILSASPYQPGDRISVAVQTDEIPSAPWEDRAAGPRFQCNGCDNHKKCHCWTIELADAWELAGRRTRQRMKLLGRNYRRLYGRNRELRRQLRATRADLRRSRLIRQQQQIVLGSIGRQVDELAANLLFAGLTMDRDAEEDSIRLKCKHPSDVGSKERSSLNEGLHGWYSALSSQLSWIKCRWLDVLAVLLAAIHPPVNTAVQNPT